MTVWIIEETAKTTAKIIVNQKTVFSTPLLVEKDRLLPKLLPNPVPLA